MVKKNITIKRKQKAELNYISRKKRNVIKTEKIYHNRPKTHKKRETIKKGGAALTENKHKRNRTLSNLAKNFMDNKKSASEYILTATSNTNNEANNITNEKNNEEKKAAEMEKKQNTIPNIQPRVSSDPNSVRHLRNTPVRKDKYEQNGKFDVLLSPKQKSLYDDTTKSAENVATEKLYNSPFMRGLSSVFGRGNVKKELNLFRDALHKGFDALEEAHEAETMREEEQKEKATHLFEEPAETFFEENRIKKQELLGELASLYNHQKPNKVQSQRIKDIMKQLSALEKGGLNITETNIETAKEFAEEQRCKIPKEIVRKYLNVKYLLQQTTPLNKKELEKVKSYMKILKDNSLAVDTIETRLFDASTEAEHILNYMNIQSLTNRELQDIRSKITFDILEFKRHIDKNIHKKYIVTLTEHYKIPHDQLMETIYNRGYQYLKNIQGSDGTNTNSLLFLVIERLEEKKGTEADTLSVYNKMDELGILVLESDEMRKEHILRGLVPQIVESNFEKEKSKFVDNINWLNSTETKKQKRQVKDEKVNVIKIIEDFTKGDTDFIIKDILKNDKTKNGPLLNWNERGGIEETIWQYILNNSELKQIYYNTIINHFVKFFGRSHKEFDMLNKTIPTEQSPFDFNFINTVVEYLEK